MHIDHRGGRRAPTSLQPQQDGWPRRVALSSDDQLRQNMLESEVRHKQALQQAEGKCVATVQDMSSQMQQLMQRFSSLADDRERIQRSNAALRDEVARLSSEVVTGTEGAKTKTVHHIEPEVTVVEAPTGNSFFIAMAGNHQGHI